VVSFVAFHEHGFSVLAGWFIRAILWAYDLKLQHLNPNGIQHLAAFEALCEGYLGVEAYWHLICYFYGYICLRGEGRPATIGYVALQLKRNRSSEYLTGPLTNSNSGWHSKWFYLRNDDVYQWLLRADLGGLVRRVSEEGPPEATFLVP
jgi:hypothetical protein